MNNHAANAVPHENESAVAIPDYELMRPIGEGGFGRVWLAKNTTTGRPRAVKLVALRTRGAIGPAGREITSLTRLETNLRHQYENLMTIHHVGKTDEYLYYVMDLADDVADRDSDVPDGVPGDNYRPLSLESWLARGPLAPEDCLRCAEQLLGGLASLHEAGMVHRDVKPSNCLFVGGRLKLADFGLVAEAGPQVSRVGTQKYMPPDGRMDIRADVYAAGLVVYEMITALPPESFPWLGSRAAEVARSPALCGLMRLTLRACHPDWRQRHEDARVMLDELQGARQTGKDRSHGRRRRLIIGSAVAVILVAVMIGMATLFPPWSPSNEPPRVDVNFITSEAWFDATIYLDGEPLFGPDHQPLLTPCTVDDLPARSYHVVLKRDGREDRNLGQIDFGEIQQVNVR